MSYDQLRVLSFRLRRDRLPSVRYWQVDFPEAWKDAVRDLARTKYGQRDTTPPIDSLNSAIRALVPDVVSIQTRAAFNGPRPWLLARTALDANHLLVIVRAWLGVHFRTVNGFDRAYETMRAEHLAGRFEELPLDVRATSGGTAELDPSLFSLIPNELAARLAQSGRWAVPDEGQPRALVRVGGGAEAPAEVMTWPPYVHTPKDVDWHFSTVLSFALETIPFDPEPVVNLSLSVRRWMRCMEGRPLRIPGGQRTHVYMRPRPHWMGNSMEADCFQVAPIGWVRDGEEFRIDWRDLLGELMGALAFPRSPNLQRLLDAPTSFFDDELAMGIVFDTGAIPEHKVRPGWMPADRKPMFEAVAARMESWLHPVSLLSRSERKATTTRRPAPPMPPKPADDEALKLWEKDRKKKLEQAERRAQIERVLPGIHHVDLLHQHPDTLQALRDAMTNLVGVPAQESSGQYRWELAGTTLVALPRRLGALGAALPVSPRSSPPRPEYLRALGARAQQIATELRSWPAAVAALVELQGKDGFGTGEQSGDPKGALRKGAALAGRVTQFLTPPKSIEQDEEDEENEEGANKGNLAHRARMAWRDLLRQLGVATTTLDFAKPGELPDGLQYAGVWLINTNSRSDRAGVRLPVAVRMRADGSEVLARIGTPELRDWMPYPDALRALASLERVEFHMWGADSVAHFVRDVHSELLGEGPLLLLAEAQNMRVSWSWIRNGRMELDRVQLPPAAPQPVATWPGLRVVRVRVSDQSETPEAYAVDGDEIGFSKGQWGWSPRVFLSTGSKPTPMKALSAQQSRLRPYSTSKGARKANPGGSAWNPACVELVAMALQGGDDPVLWAGLVHRLRFVASHFDDPLTLPLPLHLAQQLDEYIIPTKGK